ncbi:thioredoxin-related transmembrane protein 4 isoform X2 [Hyla sarda]|uniref:thioredoxin-related transmembrane protein 4 isoform X2 n=1 Tax=Hyla sarda TaxID=327740 RepID=UPI0024C21E1B|nr:thioredoxin-related transmembrane protein 4 isoform X2 [Hyla sarda]
MTDHAPCIVRTHISGAPSLPQSCAHPVSPGGGGEQAAVQGLSGAHFLITSSHIMAGPGRLTLLVLCSVLCGAEEGAVRTVTSRNWTAVLEGQWMVTFFAPWCPACQQIKPEWENFAKRSPRLDVNVAKVDVTEEPGLSGRFFVTTLPTIYHVKDGVFRRYHGSRMAEDLHTFIAEKKWEVIEPVAGWKAPSSILMSGMAGLFHLSGWIRQTHNYFTGPLGIPAWGSYIIFIVATLVIGLILGLILVLLADCFCPAKPKRQVVRSEINKDDADISDNDQKDSTDGLKETLDNEDVIEEDNEGDKEDDKAEDSEDDNSDSDAKDSQGDSAVEKSDLEDEEERDSSPQPPSTPETESALRHRRTEAADSGE